MGRFMFARVLSSYKINVAQTETNHHKGNIIWYKTEQFYKIYFTLRKKKDILSIYIIYICRNFTYMFLYTLHCTYNSNTAHGCGDDETRAFKRCVSVCLSLYAILLSSSLCRRNCWYSVKRKGDLYGTIQFSLTRTFMNNSIHHLRSGVRTLSFAQTRLQITYIRVGSVWLKVEPGAHTVCKWAYTYNVCVRPEEQLMLVRV